jgi:hypothetical protein
MTFPLAAGLLACALLAAPAAAQEDTLPVRTQAIAVLPLHAAFGFYAGEYERAVGETATLGLGASYFSLGDEADDFFYSSVEVKARYYPSADPLKGLSFGITAGPTFLRERDNFDGARESVTALGIGFELARSHILGRDQRFYYGYGGGFKRLFYSEEGSRGETTIPTLRLSIGYAF